MTEELPQEARISGRLRPHSDGTPLPSLSFALTTPTSRSGATSTARDAFMRKWAPPGSDTWYATTIKHAPESGRKDIEASLVVPNKESWQLTEALVSRIGGPTAADLAFRNQLYLRIGLAAASGGRIEAAMKRLILHMSGSLHPKFSDSEYTWKVLDQKLRAAASKLGETAKDVVAVLDWGSEKGIREIRNDLIHAFWWEYDGVGITRGRVHLDGTSELIQITLDQLDENCRALQDYADMLDSAIQNLWLTLYLPRHD